MDKFMDLGTLVLLVVILAGIIIILYNAYKLKKNDGKIDNDEKGKLFQQIRDMALNLVKEALEIQKQQNQGDAFVRDYIVNKLTIVVSESTVLTQAEKDIIITYLLEEAVDTVLKLLGYNIVQIKQELANTNYYQKVIAPNINVKVSEDEKTPRYDDGTCFDDGSKFK
jgi:hypothetical protein